MRVISLLQIQNLLGRARIRNKLCSNCHEASALKAGGTVDHSPFKEGMCDSCHQPHASEYPKLVLKEGNTLCFDCHKEKGAKVGVVHKPVESGKGCLSCHPPHAAKNKKLLNMKGAELCFTCHAKTKEAAKLKKPHVPFTEGECNSCHNPHGSNTKNIVEG